MVTAVWWSSPVGRLRRCWDRWSPDSPAISGSSDTRRSYPSTRLDRQPAGPAQVTENPRRGRLRVQEGQNVQDDLDRCGSGSAGGRLARPYERDPGRAWLTAHPGAQIVCRDRAGTYSKVIAQAVPGAVEVARPMAPSTEPGCRGRANLPPEPLLPAQERQRHTRFRPRRGVRARRPDEHRTGPARHRSTRADSCSDRRGVDDQRSRERSLDGPRDGASLREDGLHCSRPDVMG